MEKQYSLRSMETKEEQTETIRLLTELTKAGGWVSSCAPEGTISSVLRGEGFRKLMGYTDETIFPIRWSLS